MNSVELEHRVVVKLSYITLFRAMIYCCGFRLSPLSTDSGQVEHEVRPRPCMCMLYLYTFPAHDLTTISYMYFTAVHSLGSCGSLTYHVHVKTKF